MSSSEIDFVIPFVDGSDSIWLEKKKKYTGSPENEGDSREIRYRSWNNLQLWFRTIESFCPWVRKIFLITDHQVPEWLNDSMSKVVTVDHEDFIPSQYLPTFSSHVIELNLHRIKDLSETFVYFNDDVFVTRPMKETDFFHNGLPCDYAIEGPVTAFDPLFAHVLVNNSLLLNELFDRRTVRKEIRSKLYSPANIRGMFINIGYSFLNYRRFFGFESPHVATNYLKSSFEEMWERAYPVLNETCRRHFRTDYDVNQYIIQQYQYIMGRFHPSGIARKCKMFRLDDGKNGNIKSVVNAIRQQRYCIICLNEAQVMDFEYVSEEINNALMELVPSKSSFEL